jgi:hypothetical protein
VTRTRRIKDTNRGFCFGGGWLVIIVIIYALVDLPGFARQPGEPLLAVVTTAEDIDSCRRLTLTICVVYVYSAVG